MKKAHLRFLGNQIATDHPSRVPDSADTRDKLMRRVQGLLCFSLLAVAGAVQAAVALPSNRLCLEFGTSADHFEGETTPRRSPTGYFGLAMQETTFSRAAYGSIVLDGGTYRIGLTKNTNTATVTYQCDIGTDTLNGQCNVLTLSGITLTTTLSTDVGFLAFGNCAASAGASALETYDRPFGEVE